MAHVPGEEGLTRDLQDILLQGKSWPLPRLSAAPAQKDDRYEVFIAGAGPAGLFLALNLARLGLSDSSLLCIDRKAKLKNAGHADGINARSLEILATLGLEAELMRDGGVPGGFASWRRPVDDPGKLVAEPTHTSGMAPSRFGDFRALHQGRIERIFTDDLARYSRRGVQYATSLVAVRIDESDSEYPIEAVIEQEGVQKTIRTKYLISAEGTRSVTRKHFNIEQEGQSFSRVWGVIDLVVDTDFPTIRMTTQLPSNRGEGQGHAFIIPRERLSNGDWLTRIYVDVTDYDAIAAQGDDYDLKAFRASVTSEMILKKANEKMSPYYVRVKDGTSIHWWAAYSFAQHCAKQQIVRDAQGEPRVFLIGDAAHSHSPSQGLGMNTGIQDAYNLSWKLAHSLCGLAPSRTALLNTYEHERLPVAKKLVYFDRQWNTTADINVPLEVRMKDMAQFSTSCGLEFPPSLLVERALEPTPDPNRSEAYLAGVLRPGRRLLNTKVKRCVNGARVDLHSDLLSNGRWRIIVLTASDFPAGGQKSASAVAHVCASTVPRFVPGLVEAIIIMPESEAPFSWLRLPPSAKAQAEMRTYAAAPEVYSTYGVARDRGAVVVVRPDGVVGMVARLGELDAVEAFLVRCVCVHEGGRGRGC